MSSQQPDAYAHARALVHAIETLIAEPAWPQCRVCASHACADLSHRGTRVRARGAVPLRRFARMPAA